MRMLLRRRRSMLRWWTLRSRKGLEHGRPSSGRETRVGEGKCAVQRHALSCAGRGRTGHDEIAALIHHPLWPRRAWTVPLLEGRLAQRERLPERRRSPRCRRGHGVVVLPVGNVKPPMVRCPGLSARLEDVEIHAQRPVEAAPLGHGTAEACVIQVHESVAALERTGLGGYQEACSGGAVLRLEP